MSVFGDFQRVWLQRFPNSALPAAWEEDVRANLAKHKQKVAVLKEELEKEEFYVEYLERLLSDVEQHKKASRDSIKSTEISESITLTDDNGDKVRVGDKLSKESTENIVSSIVPADNTEPQIIIENNQCSVNQCVSELSVGLSESVQRSNSVVTQSLPIESTDKLRRNTDPSNFVTVIEVNGLKNKHSESNEYISSKKKVPPKPPPKNLVKREHSLPETDGETPSSENARSKESLVSSTEQLATEIVSHSDSLDSVSPDGEEEPYYDSVAGDPGEYVYIQGGRGSSTDDISSNASTLPLPAPRSHTSSLASVTCEPESPGKSSNYVNIEYFIQKRSGTGDTRSSSDGECDDDDLNVPPLLRTISVDPEVPNEEGSYASSSSLESATPSSKRKFFQDVDSTAEAERMTMYRCIISNIIESETVYVECLNVMIQYMKALRAAVGSSQSVISEDEYKTIFYKIPELHSLHSEFLDKLKKRTINWDGHIGDCFKLMASKLILYGSFLHNYGNATDTVRKCCANNARFSEIAKHMKCKYLSGQSISLEDLLHKPVARVQKNALVLHDLLKYTPASHPDYKALKDALSMTQDFLDEFNQIQTKSMFPATDRAQRRLVKNSFIVELVDEKRKLRHLFLFNDVIACAKYKVSSGRNERYTFELKWFIPLGDILILEECNAEPRENSPANIVALKSQACTVRDQILLEERTGEDKRIRLGSRSEKNRKKLAELEAQLVLASPNLVFRIKNKNSQRTQVFFLSSEFERMQWIESIHALKMSCTPPAPTATVGMLELQAWITACRTFLKTDMGSYLLRSGRDESLLVGDLHVTIKDLKGLERQEDVYVCIEIDFYGHFFRKAKSKLVVKSKTPVWNETFVIDLEGSENLRLLIYQDTEPNPILIAKHTQKLSRSWLGETSVEKSIQLNNSYVFNMTLKFIPSEVTLRRVPTAKPGALFGAKIQQVCKRQKRDIPFIITACVREVERRGMSEVGIYRVSGSASDLLKIKKSFESNSYEAEQLLKEVDIHSVTGILKLYLRELPEALFTDQLYPQLFEAYNLSNSNQTRRFMLLMECFGKLPEQNQRCINFLLEHLIRVNQHESENKMSLHNLATVFGPTLLRPGGKAESSKQRDMLAAGTVDVMAQAGILYCILEDMRARASKPV